MLMFDHCHLGAQITRENIVFFSTQVDYARQQLVARMNTCYSFWDRIVWRQKYNIIGRVGLFTLKLTKMRWRGKSDVKFIDHEGYQNTWLASLMHCREKLTLSSRTRSLSFFNLSSPAFPAIGIQYSLPLNITVTTRLRSGALDS